MNHSLGMTIEALVAVLLLITIGYCMLLNNRLKRLRSDEHSLKAVIAELPTYGYRRVHAVLKRQALAAGLKPPNHKRVYRVMKVHGLLLDRHVGGDERRHDGRLQWMNVIGVGAPTALRSAATMASGCGLRLRSTAVIGKL